jgi:hypothetical protein
MSNEPRRSRHTNRATRRLKGAIETAPFRGDLSCGAFDCRVSSYNLSFSNYVLRRGLSICPRRQGRGIVRRDQSPSISKLFPLVANCIDHRTGQTSRLLMPLRLDSKNSQSENRLPLPRRLSDGL